MGLPSLRVRGLGKRYRLRSEIEPTTVREFVGGLFAGRGGRAGNRPGASREAFWALRDVSFETEPGETVGVIGRNGAGKSTLLKILSRVTEPTEGTAEIRGRVGSLLDVGTGFHPDLTGRENVFLNASLLGMRRQEIRTRVDSILDFAGIERFIDVPVKWYSSGMSVRLAFAVAAHVDADVLLVDEALSVGDEAFRRKSLDRVRALAEEGRTVLLVSHNLYVVRGLCQRVLHLDEGRLLRDGPAGSVVDAYLADVETPLAVPA